MKNPVFTGACVAIVTPFRNGKVDFDGLGELIEMQIAAGTDAICICGTTGESSTMSMQEHRDAIQYCVDRVNHRCVVIAGTGSNCTATALELSLHAQECGADGLLLVTPYYNKTTQAGLIQHYTYIADRVNIPMILYNVPSRTGVAFTAETYHALSKHPMINGVKEASGNFTLIARTRALCGDELNIWSGNDDQVVPLMSLGGKGVISVLANILPQVMVEMTHACLEKDYVHAANVQTDYIALCDALFSEVNPIPVKAAMEMMGLCSGEVRMPLCEISPAHRAQLREELLRMGVKLA